MSTSSEEGGAGLPPASIPAPGVVAAIARLVRALTQHQRRLLVGVLERHNRYDDACRSAILSAHPSKAYFDAVSALCDAWSAWVGRAEVPSPPTIAMAMDAAALVEDSHDERVELVWTGPATEIVTARQTTGVLFQLIEEAVEELTLMTFAAYPIPGLVEALRAARERGVRVRFVLESVDDSAGRLKVDAAEAFEALDNMAFYVWPRDQRPPGASMHAKGVIVDRRVAFITSANLTEHAIEKNIELGVVIRGGDVPNILVGHIDRLVSSGHLHSLRGP